MAKNLDGIKKLSGEELRKSRKMVLDYIGEEDKGDKPENKTIKTGNIPKTMDGIMISKKKVMSVLPKEENMKKFNNKDFLYTLSAQEEGMKNELKEEIDNTLTFTKVAEEKKKIEFRKEEELKRKKELEREVARKEEDRKKKETDEQERFEIEAMSAKKQKLKEEQEFKREVARKEEARKQKKKLANEKKEENKRKKDSLEALKKRRKNRKKKKRKDFKNRIIRRHKDVISYLKDGFKGLTSKKASKFLLCIVFFVFSLMLFSYILFSFILLRVSHDSEVIRRIAVYVPAPAIVFNKGIISYNKYNELYKGKNSSLIGETLALKKIASRYNLIFNENELETLKLGIRKKVIEDREINKVSFMLIDDIRDKIISGVEFNGVKDKFENDESELDDDIFTIIENSIKDLNINELSDTIITNNGIYIAKKKVDDFDYIRIDNVNLDEYLANEISKLKIFKLVK